jgi:hypothetical protein
MVAASNAALHGYAPWFVTRAPPRMGLNANTTHPRRMSRLRFAPKSPRVPKKTRKTPQPTCAATLAYTITAAKSTPPEPGKVRSTGNHWHALDMFEGRSKRSNPGWIALS